MKILVLQLARLGDLFLTWPALRALRKKYPTAQIDVLTRVRFAEALRGCESVTTIRTLDTKGILEPLIQDEPNIVSAFQEVDRVVNDLKGDNYDWIVNLSFSPASSYLTHAIANESTRVSGYSRFSDGYLAIPDDISAYFYAQVGPNYSNRFHLAEIFGSLFQVDLSDEDWAPPSYIKAMPRTRHGIVIHIGASESRKALSAPKWSAIINQLRKVYAGPISLIGVGREIEIAENILNSVPTDQVKNYVGQSSIEDTFRLLSHSELLIGCDSAPIHMASLTNTPCLNISLPTVNFWETGPRSKRSFVLKTLSEVDLPSDRVAQVAAKVIAGEAVDIGVATGQSGTPSYRALSPKEQDFQWKLTSAIYQGEPFPEVVDSVFVSAIEKLADVNQLMLEQMKFIQSGGDIGKVAGIIDRGEEIIAAIGQLSPSISPLIRWYQTEKMRIGPGETASVLQKTMDIHVLLEKATAVYLPDQKQVEEAL